MRVGRNDPCPCGSGKKHKNCCEGKKPWTPSVAMTIAIASIVTIGAVALAMRGNKSDAPRSVAGRRVPISTAVPRAQPLGPAPEGKVWSAEHGHWHDAAGAAAPMQSPIKVDTMSVPAPTGAMSSPPPGPAPAGKVWSSEHGHWHDSTGISNVQIPAQMPGDQPPAQSTAQAFTPAPQPPGPVPPGKVWSVEHGHWHDKPQ